MKKMVKIIAIFISSAILLDFVPIKFAVRESQDCKSDLYLCKYTQVTGGNWEDINHGIFIDELKGNSFYTCLRDIYLTDYIEPSGNLYLMEGKLIEKNTDEFDLDVKKWDIIYPISRKSYRVIYAPKGYLTIYDYDWYKLFILWRTKCHEKS